jgi:acyl-CoA thioesterase-1
VGGWSRLQKYQQPTFEKGLVHPVVYHVASGQVFFSGAALLLFAAICGFHSHWLMRRGRVLGSAIAISSTPLPYWLLTLAMAISLAWLLANWWSAWRLPATIAFCLVWIAAAAWEASYLFVPSISAVDERAISIIGDSVSAGMGEHKVETWPKIFARQHHVRVQDLSTMGDKTSHAIKRIKAQPVDAPLVLIEIGGNDVLGGTSAAKFHEDLDALLSALPTDNHRVVMFELPLPPLRGDFGRAQRSLARKHGVLLVPKRIMLDVLAAEGATVDTIHLSRAGHQQMADAVWMLLESAWN